MRFLWFYKLLYLIAILMNIVIISLSMNVQQNILQDQIRAELLIGIAIAAINILSWLKYLSGSKLFFYVERILSITRAAEILFVASVLLLPLVFFSPIERSVWLPLLKLAQLFQPILWLGCFGLLISEITYFCFLKRYRTKK